MIRNEILRTGNNFCQQVNESVGFSTLKPCSGSPERKVKLPWQFFFSSNELKQCWTYKYPTQHANLSLHKFPHGKYGAKK